MIGFLEGTLESKGEDHVTVAVGGVGFLVYVPSSILPKLPGRGGRVRFHTHLHVKEDALTLYGFEAPEEIEMFQLLMHVSGVGPRVALGVVSSLSPDEFSRAVLYGDADRLLEVPGVGKKLAQRLVLELQERVGAGGKSRTARRKAAPSSGGPAAEAVEALVSLGYNRAEAAEAIEAAFKAAAAGGATPRAEALVRDALRLLGAEGRGAR